MAKELTVANSVFVLGVTGLFDVPQLLQGFVADNPFSQDDVTIAETVMTMEGNLSAGYTPSSIMQTITILPDSPSAQFFSDWVQASKTDSTLFRCYGNLTIPGLQANYTLTSGVLKTAPIIPSAGKILKPLSFKIEWPSNGVLGVSI